MVKRQKSWSKREFAERAMVNSRIPTLSPELQRFPVSGRMRFKTGLIRLESA